MNILRYAISANAFILANIPQNYLEKIRHAILFGSAARGAANKESDIDLFYDVMATRRQIINIKREINNMIDEFYISTTGLAFRLKGTSNPISAKVGRLDEWVELKSSIAKNNIQLYGPYSAKIAGEPAFLIWWPGLPEKSRGAILNALYGFRVHGKRYAGLLHKTSGKRIGKSAIMVPAREFGTVEKFLQKYKINYKIIDIALV